MHTYMSVHECTCQYGGKAHFGRLQCLYAAPVPLQDVLEPVLVAEELLLLQSHVPGVLGNGEAQLFQVACLHDNLHQLRREVNGELLTRRQDCRGERDSQSQSNTGKCILLGAMYVDCLSLVRTTYIHSANITVFLLFEFHFMHTVHGMCAI